jgi:hypothetical protein
MIKIWYNSQEKREHMRKLLFISLATIATAMSANAAPNWWDRPTICKMVPTKCYSNISEGTPGYYFAEGNTDTWDESSNCWGLKMICPNALLESTSKFAVPMDRTSIAAQKNISSDFNTDVLSTNDDCYGVRKTSADGSRVSVGGEYVNVWCSGVISSSDRELEETAKGEAIVSGTQPTCGELARDEYVALLDEKQGCYGKYFDSSKYYIDCGVKELPERLIVLNGAYYSTTSDNTLTPDSAEKIFNTMFDVSKTQREKYIK